jgi:ribonuclease PH
MTIRADGRTPDELRSVTIERGWSDHAEGSALITFGGTKVLCTASFTSGVPRWKVGKGEGWVTAEYSMLPRATHTRNDREAVKGKIGGRTPEISRLIGRSLRAVVDVSALGENTIVIDCDVLQADGGTRTAAITGASVAMALACEHLVRRHEISIHPMQKLVAAVSVGIVHSQAVLDLDYLEDRDAQVDLNLVMNESLEFIELQASGEENVFNNDQLASMLAYGREGISQLVEYQRSVLREHNIFIKKSS